MIEDKYNDFVVWGLALRDDYGWDVHHAPGPVEALELLDRNDFDVVIIDRQLPDPKTGERRMIGDELLETITARWRNVCPIMLTNFSDLEAAQRATKNGAFHYFLKDQATVADLNRACHKGLQRQLARRTRYSVLYHQNPAEVLEDVKQSIQRLFNPPGYCFAYLRFEPALRLGDYVCEEPKGPLARVVKSQSPFLEICPASEWVRKERRPWLKTTRVEIASGGGKLLDDPGSQLIVPVLAPDYASERMPTEVVALIWIESGKEDAFDKEDALTVLELAEYVGVALDRANRIEKRGQEAGERERDALLSEILHRIFNPLQIASTTLDLLDARLSEGEEIETNEICKKIASALKGIDSAIDAAKKLRQSGSPIKPQLRPLDLRPIVQEIVTSYQPTGEVEDCVVDAKIADEVPLVNLDLVEVRYTINCMLDNSIEAIRRRRIRDAQPSLQGRISIVLTSGGVADKGVMLSIKDNGAGIEKSALPRRIFDRLYSSKDDFRSGAHGLGLWQAQQFIEVHAKGVIEVESNSRDWTIVKMFLPAVSSKTTPIAEDKALGIES